MTKRLLNILFMVSAILVGLAVAANAVEIPSYIEDVNDVRANINPIIENLTSHSQDAGGAQDDEEFQNIIFRQLSAKLYAEALTTRTKVLKAEKEKEQTKKEKAAELGDTSDKQKVLVNEIKPRLRSIAERLNNIVSLEASIASLEGTRVIINMPKEDTSLNTDGGEGE